MQAQKMMDFVTPHDPFADKPDMLAKDKQAAFIVYLSSCRQVLKKHPQRVEILQTAEDGGAMKIFEASLRVVADDGSYLHINVGGIEQTLSGESMIDDVIVTMIEHTPEGRAITGYMYHVDEDVVTRSTVPIDSEDQPTEHFSLIDQYSLGDELRAKALSDDAVEAEGARALQKEVEEATIVALAEHEIGLDDLPVTFEEVEKLGLLLERAVPFALPED